MFDNILSVSMIFPIHLSLTFFWTWIKIQMILEYYIVTVTLVVAVALAADMALLALAVVALAVGPLRDAGRASAVPAPVPTAVPATLQHKDCGQEEERH